MLYTDSGSPIPNDKPMEQFKASEEDWRKIERSAENPAADYSRAVCELRDRVAELEKKARTAEKCNDAICRRLDEIRRKEPAATEESSPDRVLVRSQTGEYLRAGTPVYLAAPAAAVPSDRELMQMWNEAPRGVGLGLRVVWNHGYQQGLAAGRAEQQATTEPATKSEPEPGDFQTLHGIALDMVDSLRPIVIPEILNVLRRAIREPMAEQQAAAEATPEPEPEPVHSQYFSGHGLIAGEIDRALAEGGWTPTPEPTPEPEPSPSPAADGGLEDVIAKTIRDEPCLGRPLGEFGHLWWMPEARPAIRAEAKWLRSIGHFSAATNLEREANR